MAAFAGAVTLTVGGVVSPVGSPPPSSRPKNRAWW
ncbi:hypothetical protein LILAB_08665 [Corallococcus macrosporus]|uniref:Uncharacterized protein n=1 Tax=Myxococcus fulvus (strain ATCC BAA-855 / HW-1) TaxID=483219 RepID=F8CGT5_MYXFH|nr:hypothetical protein LILAB_08665 [Corallococcus macrosporus]